MRLLAIDVGTGTQDILLWEADRAMENCFQMIMPSPTAMAAAKIRAAAEEGRGVHLLGNLQGGGPVTRAVREHLRGGLSVTATPRAAKSFHDDPEVVRSWGVEFAPAAPAGAVAVRLGDVDREALERAFGAFGVELPKRFAVAVQDHGEAVGESNRRVRFRYWQQFMDEGGELCSLLYQEPPERLTRMRAVREDLPGAWVMDTGPAAFLGALEDPQVSEWAEQGVLLINTGNSHTLLAVVRGERVLALAEHHTGRLDPAGLSRIQQRLLAGELSFEEVYDSGGHGVAYAPDYRPRSDLPAAVTGPRRALAADGRRHLAVPHGDMMLAGCYGLVRAVRMREGRG